MSDGNYNRNLLPYRDYQSGVRAGRVTMRTRAMEKLRELLEKTDLSEEQQAEMLREFHAALK